MSQMNLELQLKLNDRLSAGMGRALKELQSRTKSLKNELDATAKAANNIKPTGIERITKALREARSVAKGTLDILNRTAQAGAALAAGAYVAKRAYDKPIAYDRQLALTANVAYSDRNVSGRIAGKLELDKAVRNAQRLGLGSQEQVLATLNDLIGSGAMGEGRTGVKNSIDLLPTIAQASSGTGADPADIAKIVMAGKQNMKMTNPEIKRFLSQAITAANLGGFELKDMARYLPAQMANYASNGGMGVKGAEDLLAYNQVSRVTSGSSEQAGINMDNLLSKINSNDTRLDFKKQGIDLTGSLVAAREKGIGGLDAFMSLVDQVASRNPEYKNLQARAATQKGPEQKATFDAMMNIMEQKGISSVVQDRQAMMALLGARLQKDKLNEVRNAVRADQGTQIGTNFGVVDSTTSASAERLANEKDIAGSNSLNSMEGPLNKMLRGVVELANANPKLATATYAATTALAALAASSGIAAILGRSSLKDAGKVTRAAKKVAGPVLGAAAATGLAGEVAAVGGLSTASLLATAPAMGVRIGNNASIGETLVTSISLALAPLISQLNQALKVDVHLDGEKIASNTQKRVGRTASRK